MKYTPHEYQTYAAEFIKAHPISAVFLDMGLGKTSITLTAIADMLRDSFEVRRVLVIAPLRVALNTWPAEIEKWDHLQGLSYAAAVGNEKERRAAFVKHADITIINRENLQWLVDYSGIPFDFDMVVIDELSSFKNHQSKRWKAMMKVRPRVKRIVGLTGTPASNSLMDLCAEFRVLDMGERLGRFITAYRTDYFTPDKRNGQIVYSYKLLPGAEDAIYHKISDITISMKAADHLKMPELVNSEYAVYLSESEKAHYEQLKRNLVLTVENGEITAANAAALSNKLCQMTNGAIYDDDGKVTRIHDRKLDALEDIIEAANGSPVLVAYWYKHDLDRIKARLDSLNVAYGLIDKDESIAAWNSGEIPVGLIHPASAGHGLNLQQGGSTIVWFSIPWSLELYTQAVDRLFRQGQKSETVSVIHIVTKGTIDERVMKALSQKELTQTALIDAVKSNLDRKEQEP